MQIKDLKKATTFDEQIEKYRQRGLIISDNDLAVHILSQIGYYRFSGYTYLYYENNNGQEKFSNGVTLEEIFKAYKMDEEFRALLLRYLSGIEIRLKSSISNRLGLRLGSGFYMEYDPEIFIDKKNHTGFRNVYDSEKSRSKLLFVEHHNKYYGGRLPVWAAMEILSFGDVSRMYSNLRDRHRRSVEQDFNGINFRLLSSWFQGLSIVRNMCAHNNRLYRAEIPYTYRNNDKNSVKKGCMNYAIEGNKLFNVFQIICICMNGDDERKQFISEIKTINDKYSGYGSLSLMTAYGFTENWENILLTQK